MTHRTGSALLSFVLVGGLLAMLPIGLQAREEAKISALTYFDRQFMQQQRDTLDGLSRRHFGRQFNGNRDNDLELMQMLLDRRVVRPEQTAELQAMGIVMGDLLAADLGMQWVVYEDRAGRSRALRYRESDHYLFPVTMISRRREAGNERPVREIYDKAYAIIDEVRPPLPFQ